MTGRVKTNTQGHLMRATAVLMLFLALAANCSRTPTTPASQTQQQASPQVKTTPPPPTPAPSPAKVELNNEERGTTADLSEFTKFLKQVLETREEQRVLRFGTDIVEKTVFVKPERTLKLGEVVKVFKAVAEAGASPLKLLVRPKPRKEGEEEPRPSMLTLRVDVGNDENTEDVEDGIELRYPYALPVDREGKNALLGVAIVIEIPKEGEYIVNGKPVGKSALKGELQSRRNELLQGRIITVLIPENSQLGYTNLSDVANAASEVQAELIELRILAP
jgi:biopolymer transport protein ExbD